MVVTQGIVRTELRQARKTAPRRIFAGPWHDGFSDRSVGATGRLSGLAALLRLRLPAPAPRHGLRGRREALRVGHHLRLVVVAAGASPGEEPTQFGLPELDGYQVARHVRGQLGPSILLVAITGYGRPDDRRRALDSGFDVHLTKPVDPEHLTALLSGGTPATLASQTPGA